MALIFKLIRATDQTRSAVPQIYEAQTKKFTDGVKNRILLACGNKAITVVYINMNFINFFDSSGPYGRWKYLYLFAHPLYKT